MRTRGLLIALVALTGGALAAPPVVSADSLVVPVTGAHNLAAGGGWMAWAQRDGARWKLVTRSPAGVVADAPIPAFGSAPDPSIGSTGYGVSAKRVVAVYSRCRGASARVGCDVYRYDLAAKTERRVTSISTAQGSEVAPSIALGQYGFVRIGGPSPGTYAMGRLLHRVDTRLALETAVSLSRIAYVVSSAGKRQVVISQYDASRKRVIGTSNSLFNVVITRYRVGWLERAAGSVTAKMTDRINPSTTKPVVRDGRRPLPASTNSATADDTRISLYLDAKGIHELHPHLFR